ncbi:membrane protein insertion efficiency factor YidD [bacterium]|nr:membrane protein insertion efficiency factor YidD [bacterium]
MVYRVATTSVLILLSLFGTPRGETKDIPILERLDSLETEEAVDTLDTRTVSCFFEAAILFYQHFITTQDAQECQFRPSCSEFALASFRLTDPVQAYLMTTDRLIRCNPTARKYYDKDKENFLVDPPEEHILW